MLPAVLIQPDADRLAELPRGELSCHSVVECGADAAFPIPPEIADARIGDT
jgi:hypothetical protein